MNGYDAEEYIEICEKIKVKEKILKEASVESDVT
jgi:hypothetical protein